MIPRRPKRRRRNVSLAVLVCASVSVAACSSGGGSSIRCSFDNPPEYSDSPDTWSKFRRDRQNTGTIVLSDSAYARIAAGATPREAAWMYPAADRGADAAFVASPVLNADGSVLFIGATDGRLIAIHASGDATGTLLSPMTNGVERDYFATAAPFAITATALVATRDQRDAIFVGAGNGRIFGLAADASGLDRIWPASADTFIATGVNLGIDGTIYGGSLGNGLIAVCPNGVPRFALLTGPTLSSPALGRDASDPTRDGSVYFGADDGLLRSIYGEGTLAWTFALSAPILAAPVVLLDDAESPSTAGIFAIDARGRLARVTPEGRPAGGFVSPSGLGRVLASPALATVEGGGHRLYVASKDSGLHAVDASTGARLWSLDVGAGIESSPAVAVSEDRDPIVVFGADDGSLYYVRDRGNAADVIATFTPDTALPIVSSPAIGADGTVFFGGLDGRVYAVD